MNSHLSSDQICQWLAGERGSEQDRHLRDCPACRAEVNRFQTVLAGFRSSLERESAPPVSRAPIRSTLPRWTLAAAGVFLLLAAPVYWNAHQQRAAEQMKADEQLLERVNASLSRSVPSSMEPLMQLISKESQ